MAHKPFVYPVPGPFGVEEVSYRTLADTVVTALEGGCNHWMTGFRLSFGDPGDTQPWYDSEELYSKVFTIRVTVDGEDTPQFLDNLAVQQGLSLMAAKYPSHLSDLLNENGDAETADVFMQLCLFKDVVYD